MEIIKNINKLFHFNRDIYLESPMFITCDKYWDGGIKTDSSLKEKSDFYLLSAKMSNIIKDIMLTLDESVFIGESLCEYEDLYEHWSDLKKYELYAEISRKIHPKKYYKISLPKDSKIVDLIVESNFRYFSNIALYFPKTDMILVPTCHTEIIVYTPSSKDVITMIETVIKRYADDECNIVCKNSNDTKYEFCD